MLDYGMCSQTVTVYRKTPQGILHFVIPNCFLQWQQTRDYVATGARQEYNFLLVQPGSEQLVFPGDRVMEGAQPKIEEAQWDTFLPGLVPGLGEVAYATAYRWQGQFCHTEAGRK